ncbi:MAG TPA: benzoate-CoA ligase family protein [Terriglobia bacterium]|nr:benzoate-CoA ligase family protein [Terriglobia bacterium]
MKQRIPAGCLPPAELCPKLVLPEWMQYPPRLNACGELLDRNLAAGRGKQPAIRHQGRTISYEELASAVETLAAALLDEGLLPGDRVLLRFRNQPEFIIAWLAVLRVGGIVVATMPLLRSREIGKILADCTPAFLLTAEDLWEEVEPALPACPGVKVIRRGARRSGIIGWEELMARPQKCPVGDTEAETLSLLAYTSGSTGEPKGTIHTHRDILAIADGYARHILSPTAEDVFGGTPPLAFTFGVGGMLVFPFRFGASTALLERFTPQALVDTIRESGITLLFCSATTYNLLLKAGLPGFAESCRSLRLCVSAGETLPAAVYNAWKEALGVEILDGIGSTEMLHIFLSSRPGHVKPGATGQPVPGYCAKIVDEQLRELPPGEAGLLAVQGPTGCRYWNRPDRQREYVRAGWNLPGDIYLQDADGYFVYQCRADDMIISSGYNIAGPEVEAVLVEHPAVQECAVVASPDPTRGSIPKAFIVPKAGVLPGPELVAELQEFVKARLAPYKYPRAVEFVPALPKTETGKIRRVELRQREMAAQSCQPKAASAAAPGCLEHPGQSRGTS